MAPEKKLALHWDNAYKKSPVEKLGWYEKVPEPSLRLIDKCRLSKEARVLNVGVGATSLVGELLTRGFKNVIANDISQEAVSQLKSVLGSESKKVQWLIDDLTKPSMLKSLEKIDLWHDRAVLHFFTSREDQDSYFSLLKSLIKSKGFAVIAVFNLDGAQMCSGLPVYRYDKKMLSEKMGNDFELLESFDYTYTMPSGDTRKYIYTLFQKN